MSNVARYWTDNDNLNDCLAHEAIEHLIAHVVRAADYDRLLAEHNRLKEQLVKTESILEGLTAPVREIAEKATKGEWRKAPSLSGGMRAIEAQAFDGSWKYICDRVRGGNPNEADANAEFIATFHPARVLALLEEVKGLRGALARAPHAGEGKEE